MAAGELGVKSGHGFYRYRGNVPQRSPVRHNEQIPGDLIDRMMPAPEQRGTGLSAGGVVSGTDLLDAGIIYGTGYAPFRSGPINFLEQSGIDEQRHHLEELNQHYGPLAH